MDKQVE